VKLVPDDSTKTEDLQERVRQLEDQNLNLMESFAEMQKHYRSENWQLHQRMSALEEMLSTMNQLFDAKLRHALTQRLG
jgi:BMFP domain-containing protein YqiC